MDYASYGKTHIMPEEIVQKIETSGIIAVLEIEDADTAVPVAQALVRGGVTAIELALRTEAAMEAIELIAREVPEMNLGVGTIIFPGQAGAVKHIGATFGVSPGLNTDIVRESVACSLPFAPGIATPSELERALHLGCRIMKFFPAEPLGGIDYLKAMNNPYRYLGIRFIPFGGLREEMIPLYARMPEILAIGGTWIAKREHIKARDWDGISQRASLASQAWHAVRG